MCRRGFSSRAGFWLSLALAGLPRTAGAVEPEWTNIGPAGQAVRAIVATYGDHPTRGPRRIVLYAGTSGSGILRSADGGASWTAVNNGLTNFRITALAVHQRELPSRAPITRYETVIYAGTFSGVFRTLDGGAGWVSVSAGLPALDITALATDSTGTVYSSTHVGAFKSMNRGESWVSINPGARVRYASAFAIDPGPPATLYAGLDGSIFKSEDAGESWTDLRPTESLVLLLYPVSIRISPFSAAIFAAGSVSLSVGGAPPEPVLFRSDDGGASWTRLAAILDIVNDVAFPDESTVLAAGVFGGVSWSADGGVTWQPGNAGFPNDSTATGVWQLVADPVSAGTVYAATGQGIYRSGPTPDVGPPRVVPEREVSPDRDRSRGFRTAPLDQAR